MQKLESMHGLFPSLGTGHLKTLSPLLSDGCDHLLNSESQSLKKLEMDKDKILTENRDRLEEIELRAARVKGVWIAIAFGGLVLTDPLPLIAKIVVVSVMTAGLVYALYPQKVGEEKKVDQLEAEIDLCKKRISDYKNWKFTMSLKLITYDLAQDIEDQFVKNVQQVVSTLDEDKKQEFNKVFVHLKGIACLKKVCKLMDELFPLLKNKSLPEAEAVKKQIECYTELAVQHLPPHNKPVIPNNVKLDEFILLDLIRDPGHHKYLSIDHLSTVHQALIWIK